MSILINKNTWTLYPSASTIIDIIDPKKEKTMEIFLFFYKINVFRKKKSLIVVQVLVIVYFLPF